MQDGNCEAKAGPTANGDASACGADCNCTPSVRAADTDRRSDRAILQIPVPQPAVLPLPPAYELPLPSEVVARSYELRGPPPTGIALDTPTLRGPPTSDVSAQQLLSPDVRPV